VQALTNDLSTAEPHLVDAAWRPVVPDAIPKPSIRNTLSRGMVASASLHHFSVIWPGAMAIAVNGRPSEWICSAASDISVFPVPHSAMTAAVRSLSTFSQPPSQRQLGQGTVFEADSPIGAREDRPLFEARDSFAEFVRLTRGRTDADMLRCRLCWHASRRASLIWSGLRLPPHKERGAERWCPVQINERCGERIAQSLRKNSITLGLSRHPFLLLRRPPPGSQAARAFALRARSVSA